MVFCTKILYRDQTHGSIHTLKRNYPHLKVYKSHRRTEEQRGNSSGPEERSCAADICGQLVSCSVDKAGQLDSLRGHVDAQAEDRDHR